MKNPVLVIMAAGMGSRYGGMKQMDPIDDEGHLITMRSKQDLKKLFLSSRKKMRLISVSASETVSQTRSRSLMSIRSRSFRKVLLYRQDARNRSVQDMRYSVVLMHWMRLLQSSTQMIITEAMHSR